MKFGIFDQNDRSGRPLAEQYEQRMEMAELYDALGFHCYHMSEHHATTLSTTPSPGVFLSAMMQRTKRLRFCPMVYLLPIYHPLRLAEEICMLDHLSRGRFDFGIGRGASPHELQAFGVDPAASPRMYAEAFEILRRYFASDSLTFEGEFWRFDDVPVEMAPYQRPHPPVWYASASPDSAVWPAANDVNIVCGGPVDRLRGISDRYRREWSLAHPKSGREALIGANRFVVVAETDREALEIGRAAWPTFQHNFMKLWNKHGTQPVNAKAPPHFEQVLEAGQGFAGSPTSVAERMAAQARTGGLNYVLCFFTFGTMSHADATASVRLFGEKVMPALREASPLAA